MSFRAFGNVCHIKQSRNFIFEPFFPLFPLGSMVLLDRATPLSGPRDNLAKYFGRTYEKYRKLIR